MTFVHITFTIIAEFDCKFKDKTVKKFIFYIFRKIVTMSTYHYYCIYVKYGTGHKLFTASSVSLRKKFC